MRAAPRGPRCCHSPRQSWESVGKTTSQKSLWDLFSAQIPVLCPRLGQALKAPKAHFISDSKNPFPVTMVNPTGWLTGVTSSTPFESSPNGSQVNGLTREGGNCLMSIKPGETGPLVRCQGCRLCSAALRAPPTEGGTGVRGRCPHAPPLRPRPGPTFPLSLFHPLTPLAPPLAIPERAGDAPALVQPAGASLKAPIPPHPFLQPESHNFGEV